MTFPLHLWCQIIPQAETQLLLLIQTNLNPNISAYAYVYVQHDYNSAPFVHTGMESLVHDKPNVRKTFAEHCRKGYVLGTSFENYRAWNFWMLNTRDIRVPAIVFHNHKYISNPNVIPADAIIDAVGNLASVLKGEILAYLQQSPLADLMRQTEIFSEAAASSSFLSTTPNPCADATHRPSPQQITSKSNKNGHMELRPRPPTRAPDRLPTIHWLW